MKIFSVRKISCYGKIRLMAAEYRIDETNRLRFVCNKGWAAPGFSSAENQAQWYARKENGVYVSYLKCGAKITDEFRARLCAARLVS